MSEQASGKQQRSRDAHALVAEYFQCWNVGDTDRLRELLHENWVDHAHPDRRTVEDTIDAMRSARSADPKFQLLVDAIIGGDEFLTVNGRVLGSGPTEKLVWMVRLEDRRIREMWTQEVH